MSGHDAEDTKQSTADMTAFVQNLLEQMQSSRIEELEQNINELRAEIGVESSPSPSVPETEKSPLHILLEARPKETRVFGIYNNRVAPYSSSTALLRSSSSLVYRFL
ncbi:hypothetical protein VNO80_20307 [Phaseolus coccineus]|uniref:Uncharacterized protein n=1 Tax=Phaseolus coccineus TaxID=3886 RepID=A0AAN9MHP1_PHACN